MSDDVTIHKLSQEQFLRSGSKLLSDPRLGNVRTDYDSIFSLVGDICLSGTSVQQMAVSDAFGLDAVISMPELKRYATTNERVSNIIKWLEVHLIDLAAFFGTKASGAMSEFAWQLYSDYGGLTILDFVKFFAMCKKRTFVSEFEHVQTQGINPDLIQKWLEKYCDKREDVIQGLQSDVNTYKVFDIEKADRNTAEHDEFKALQAKAVAMRKAYEAKYVESYMRLVNLDGQEFQIRDTRPTSDAAARMLLNFLINFVTFDEDEAMRLIRQIGERLEVEFNNLLPQEKAYFEQQGITLAVHKQQEATKTVAMFMRRLRKMGPIALLSNAMQDKFNRNPIEFTKSLGFTAHDGKYPTQCRQLAKSLEKSFSIDYIGYLRVAVGQPLPPLDMPDYLIQRALHFLTIKGFETPVDELKNI